MVIKKNKVKILLIFFLLTNVCSCSKLSNNKFSAVSNSNEFSNFQLSDHNIFEDVTDLNEKGKKSKINKVYPTNQIKRKIRTKNELNKAKKISKIGENNYIDTFNKKLKINENILAGAANVCLGLEYLKQGRKKRAKLKLNRALYLAPKLPSAHSAIAYYFETVNELDEALLHHKLAVKYSKNNPAYINNYASFLCNNGNYKQALKYFEIASKNKTYINLSNVFKNAGICAHKAGLYKLSRKYFLKVLAYDEFDELSRNLLEEVNKFIDTGS